MAAAATAAATPQQLAAAAGLAWCCRLTLVLLQHSAVQLHGVAVVHLGALPVLVGLAAGGGSGQARGMGMVGRSGRADVCEWAGNCVCIPTLSASRLGRRERGWPCQRPQPHRRAPVGGRGVGVQVGHGQLGKRLVLAPVLSLQQPVQHLGAGGRKKLVGPLSRVGGTGARWQPAL